LKTHPENNYILQGDILVTSTENNPIFDSAIYIYNGKIKDYGSKNEIKLKYPDIETLSIENSLICPGFINSHTHIPMTILRGIAEDIPLNNWLENYIFPREKKLNKEIIYYSTLLGCWEMILSGITTFSDMYIFEESVIDATIQSGLKILAGEGLFDFPSPNYGSLSNGFKYTENLLKKYSNNPKVKIAVTPHTLYTCSLDTVIKSKELAEKYNASLCIHISETVNENKIIEAKYGFTPIELLYNNNILDEKFIAVHCVYLQNKEIEIISEKNSKIVHCPVSNLKLGSGIAPLSSYLKNNICVSLGTDGPASNNSLDIIKEIQFSSILGKGINQDPTIPNAKTIFKMATKNGAKGLSFDNCGEIKIGNDADIIVFDISQPNSIPMYDPFNYLIYASFSKDIIYTIVQGEILMKNRKILTFDTDEVSKKIKEFSNIFKIL